VLGYQNRLGLLGAAAIQQFERLAQLFDTVPHCHGLCLNRSA